MDETRRLLDAARKEERWEEVARLAAVLGEDDKKVSKERDEG